MRQSSTHTSQTKSSKKKQDCISIRNEQQVDYWRKKTKVKPQIVKANLIKREVAT